MTNMGAWEDAEPGVRGRILQTRGALMLMEVQFAADAAGYEHNHVHEQVSYCVTGRFEYSLDGRTHLLTEGGSIYVPSNTRHGARHWSQAHSSMCSPRCARIYWSAVSPR